MPICCEFTSDNFCLCTNANAFESSVTFATYISVRKYICQFVANLQVTIFVFALMRMHSNLVLYLLRTFQYANVYANLLRIYFLFVSQGYECYKT